MLLSQHPALDFRTRNISVDIDHSSRLIHLQPYGNAFSFEQLQYQRHHPPTQGGNQFIATNLGVSAHIILPWSGRRFMILVSQQRPDFKDQVLKLPSGYVSLEHLEDPLKALDQELSEELLFHSGQSLLPLQRDQVQLPQPYQRVGYLDSCAQLAPITPPLLFKVCYQQDVLEGVECYLHPDSGSVQLVYHWDLQLPEMDLNPLNLWQLEERYLTKSQTLEAHWEDRQPLWLAELNDDNWLSGGIYQLQDGLLLPGDEQAPRMLSEYFAPRDGIQTLRSQLSLNEYRPYC